MFEFLLFICSKKAKGKVFFGNEHHIARGFEFPGIRIDLSPCIFTEDDIVTILVNIFQSSTRSVIKDGGSVFGILTELIKTKTE
ncbi:hypothetical protein D3C86_1035300 [compost metagenome]